MHEPIIHHVQIAIPEGGEIEARQFYADILGLLEVPKPNHLAKRGGLWFRGGDLEVHLGVDPAFVPAKKAHVAFQFADLSSLRETLTAWGFSVREDQPLPGFTRFYVDDPFGNRLECLTPASDGCE